MLAGGVSSKIGQRYEAWWTVSQILEVLVGQADSIRIEDPSFEKSEFTLRVGERTQLHQVKISNPTGKWTLATLGGARNDILGRMLEYLGDSNREFCFVSESQAPELHSLSECARGACSFLEFKEKFLSEDLSLQFRKLSRFAPHLTEEDVFDRLKRVTIHTIDKHMLERHVHVFVSSLFLEKPNVIEGKLFRLASENLLKTQTTADLISSLAAEGLKLRDVISRADAALAVHRATDAYAAGIRRKLIAEELIQRDLPRTICEKLTTAGISKTFAITGLAGAGKSAAMLQLLDEIRAEAMPVLAIRLDRLRPASGSDATGERFSFEESPAAMLAAAAIGRPCVLLIDQLDAVSTASGRQSEVFDLLSAILDEVEGLRIRSTIHVIMACRAFDWANDHRLRRLLSEEDETMELGGLSDGEVNQVLGKMAVSREKLSVFQIALLRLPQNLSIFYETKSAWQDRVDFSSGKDLYDAYWSVKRNQVNDRVASKIDAWPHILKLLVEEMTASQNLSVPKECLDEFPADYVEQMKSEGVIVQDGARVAFGHESFLDYCFARNFVRSSFTLLDHVKRGQQKLFLRAQVRQVLYYLRDSSPLRYSSELQALLLEGDVRPHIKDLVLTLVFSYSEITNEEWNLLHPIVSAHISRSLGERRSNTLGTMTWRRFFTSESWSNDERVRESIRGWLRSERDDIVNMTVNYLRFRQRKDGDGVAELLEPFEDHGGEWPLRLRSVMEWADHENSRRFFDFFLRLVENGTLDEARGPIAQNSTFWSMMYGLGANRPDWLPELVACWLRRRLKITERDQIGDWKNGLFGIDDFGKEQFSNAAKSAPSAFVESVLPVALEIAEQFAERGHPPDRDAVWSQTWFADSHSLKSSFRSALVDSLSRMAKSDPCSTNEIRSELSARSTDFSNQMLLVIYAAAAETLANEGAELLYVQQWRLECGYGDGPYTIAKRAVSAISEFCSQEQFEKVEEAILRHPYIRPQGRTDFEFSQRGQYTLLSALKSDRLSNAGKRRRGELERKFGAPFREPKPIKIRSIDSPIGSEACMKMTDEQWLSAIRKYSRLGVNYIKGRGGARELACMFQEQTKRDPERFAALLSNLPKGTNPDFYERHLAGLAESDAPDELKLESARVAYAEDREYCGSTLTGLLAGVEIPLTSEFIDMIIWTATKHPHPRVESVESCEKLKDTDLGASIYCDGINSTRGRAMNSIASLIWKSDVYAATFRPVLKQAAAEESKAVLSCVAQGVRAFARYFEDEALAIFRDVIEMDSVLLATPPCDEMLYRAIPNHFGEVRLHIECLLSGINADGRRAGGRLAALSVLWGHDAGDLLLAAKSGDANARLGVCEVASKNIADPECAAWAHEQLIKFFDDEDAEVRREAAQCFRNLEDHPMSEFTSLFAAFAESAAFDTDSWASLHALEDSKCEIASIAIFVCEKFLERFSDEARDISSRRAADVSMVSKLLFRIYQQAKTEVSSRALDLIDRMVVEGISDVDSGFSEFER